MATSLTNNRLTLNSLNLNAILGGNILVSSGIDGEEIAGTKTFPSGTWRAFYCDMARSGGFSYTCETGTSFNIMYSSGGPTPTVGGGESSSASPNSLSYFLNNIVNDSEGRKVA